MERVKIFQAHAKIHKINGLQATLEAGPFRRRQKNTRHLNGPQRTFLRSGTPEAVNLVYLDMC